MQMKLDLNTIQDDIIALTRKVGSFVLDGLYAPKTVTTKSSNFDPVTEYDRQAEAMIASHLRHRYPEFGLVGEEGSRYQADAEYRWYVDPIDGTTNFSHGVPFFAVSIGLWRGNEPVLGIVYDPCRDELFRAVRGEGAYSQWRGRSRRLQVSQTKSLDRALAGTGFPYDRATNPCNNLVEFGAFHPRVQGLRRLGVAALDLAYVAAGRFDLYWEYNLYSWDAAAAILLILEAGGQVTTLTGAPFILSERVSVAVSNGHLHEKVLTVLAAVS